MKLKILTKELMLQHGKKVVGLAMLFLLWASKLSAQDILSLDQAIATALENNFDIKLKKNESEKYQNNVDFSNYAFLPRINAGSSFLLSNNNQKQTLPNGIEKERNNLKAENLNSSINLNWTLFDGMKMFITKEKLNAYLDLGAISLKQQVLQTTAEVMEAYYNISRQQQQITAIQDQISFHEERVKMAEAKLRQDIGSKPELLQAQLDVNAKKAAKLTAEATLLQLKLKLNEILARDSGTTYAVQDSIPISKKLDLTSLMEIAFKNNPDLQISKQNIRISELLLKEKNAEKYPVLNFNSAYNFNRTNNKAVVNDFTPLFNRFAGFNYGLNLSIPLFNNYNIKRQVREAGLNVQQEKIISEKLWNNNRNAIEKAFAEYVAQQSILDLEEQNILLAKENVYIAKKRLELGLADYMNYRETLKTLSEANDRLIAARLGIKLAEIKLLQLSGSLIQ